ncbi:hypothetical protein B0H13DRAFT_1895305 [Mycena leptocephala]|nr:hypothetical protein B0H13DRAFT_1895305 [Mycena leptocephala]
MAELEGTKGAEETEAVAKLRAAEVAEAERWRAEEVGSELEEATEEIRDCGWSTMGPVVENYLNPVNSGNVVNTYRHRICITGASSWLAQANYIFDRLEITRGFDDFALVDNIDYYLQLLGPTDNLALGYLFLCPLAELQAGAPTSFRIPDRVAYWSLDPSGVDRLCDEAAQDLGFPVIQLQVIIVGASWDVGVYNRIRQFHEGKGSNPYSEEVALAIGYPLFQLSCDREALLAHLLQSETVDCYWDANRVSYTEDCSEYEQYDSASSELGDAFSIQEEDIHSVFCNAMEITLLDTMKSTKLIKVLSSSRGIWYLVSSGSRCYALEAVELLATSGVSILSWLYSLFSFLPPLHPLV